MEFIKPSYEILGIVPLFSKDTIVDAYKYIEKIGRLCYKSEDKITEDSCFRMVDHLHSVGHDAMIEHSNMVMEIFVGNIDKCQFVFDALALALANSGSGNKFLTLVKTKNSNVMIGGNLRAWSDLLMDTPDLRDLPNDAMEWCSNVTNLDTVVVTDPATLPKELIRFGVQIVHDRAFTHELVRHRPCSFAQESQRYCMYDGKQNDLTFIAPFQYRDLDTKNYPANFLDALRRIQEVYLDVLNQGIKAQLARTILPNCTKTEIAVTADLREWDWIYHLRNAPTAHPDMQDMTGKIEPAMFVEIANLYKK